uniref:Uncharacterized protein n=1 Tax=Arundo donax TaxID=35708 RepID=A0A0A9HGL3_ARUDO
MAQLSVERLLLVLSAPQKSTKSVRIQNIICLRTNEFKQI